jgi:hypothetical protein
VAFVCFRSQSGRALAALTKKRKGSGGRLIIFFTPLLDGGLPCRNFVG